MPDAARPYAHGYASIRICYIFLTKDREKLLTGPIIDEIEASFIRSCQNNDCLFIKLDWDWREKDWVKIEIDLAPNISPSTMARILKSSSSKTIRNRHRGALENVTTKAAKNRRKRQLKSASGLGGIWSRGYHVVSIEGDQKIDQQAYVNDRPVTAKTRKKHLVLSREQLERYKEGERPERLALELGVTRVTIEAAAKRQGFERRHDNEFYESEADAILRGGGSDRE